MAVATIWREESVAKNQPSGRTRFTLKASLASSQGSKSEHDMRERKACSSSGRKVRTKYPAGGFTAGQCRCEAEGHIMRNCGCSGRMAGKVLSNLLLCGPA